MGAIVNSAGLGSQANAGNFQADSGVSSQELQNVQSGIMQYQGQEQALANQLAAQGGIQNQTNVFNQQQALANALQAQSQGQGPNPAQAQLAMATGQNVQQQAAMQAGQRGAGANVGLIARQAGQQGAGIQQQAVGQGAVMQAQQQLAAQGQLQGQQQNLAGLATQQVGQQAQAVTNLNEFALQNQGQLLGARQGQNQVNASMAQANLGNQAAFTGGVLNAAGAAAGGGKAHGGMIEQMAHGGMTGKLLPDHLRMAHDIYHSSAMNMKSGGPVPGHEVVKGDSTKNDNVPAMLSAGEIVIPKSIVESENAEEKAAEFVRNELAKKIGKRKHSIKDAIKEKQ